MGVVRRIQIDHLRDGRGNVFELHAVAAREPGRGRQDDDDARKHRAYEKAPAGDARNGRRAAQRDPRGEPVHGDREESDERAVLRQRRKPDRVGDRRGGESQHGGIPDHVLNPLQKDGRESEVGVERLLHPGVDASALRREGAAQLGAHERRGDEEEERGEEDVEEHGELLLGHHRKAAQADDRGRGHQRELRGRDVFAFCHSFVCLTFPSPTAVFVPGCALRGGTVTADGFRRASCSRRQPSGRVFRPSCRFSAGKGRRAADFSYLRGGPGACRCVPGRGGPLRRTGPAAGNGKDGER